MDATKLIAAIIQARLTSTRLPRKVLKEFKGLSVIEIIVERLKKSKKLDEIIVAIPNNKENEDLKELLEAKDIKFFVGSENDVLERFHNCAVQYNLTTIVRITGDCPFVDPILVDTFLEKFNNSNVDYLSNTNPPTYPDGLDIEVFTKELIQTSHNNASKLFDREHVTTFAKKEKSIKKINVKSQINYSELRLTLDDKSDLSVIKNVFDSFDDIFFSYDEIINLYNQNAELFTANQHLKRNEGSSVSSGQKLYKKAKEIIPGGNMLLSKRPEMFLPDQWPSYFSKSKGCTVWDLDKKKYFDVCLMGVGTNLLGYANSAVDSAVSKTIKSGNLSTLNCPEEVYLAEKLIELNPWADMVKFARTGGEANSIAIRIARAATGKDNVAICGYHGWHDWYLSANLGKSKDLDGHLLPGLEPNGVPRNLEGTSFSFQYNDLEGLKKLIENNEIGIIKMEVMRNHPPKNNFLEEVRQLAHKNNIVLIFDECTSGFRETNSGLHQKFNVQPDIAIYGKTLGNGYAITSIVGKKDVMDHAQSSFISSTFWTERIGPTAAIASIKEMNQVKSWEVVCKKGKEIKKSWKKIFSDHDLNFEISGLDPLPSFSSQEEDFLKIKSFITHDMLQKGFLASNAIYLCTEHSDQILSSYLDAFEDTISKISNQYNKSGSIDQLIDFPLSHGGFKRLN